MNAAGAVARFWARVDKRPDGCWVWTGTQSRGYGQIILSGRVIRVHRYSWFLHKGVWPDPRLTLDHLCRNKACVNPDHLEEVSAKENVRRAQEDTRTKAYATHCVNGHEFTKANTWVSKQGFRRCRRCWSEKRSRADRSSRATAEKVLDFLSALPEPKTASHDSIAKACGVGTSTARLAVRGLIADGLISIERPGTGNFYATQYSVKAGE